MYWKQQKENIWKKKAREIRRGTLRAIGSIGSGHVGGSLSLAEVLAVLYFEQMPLSDPARPDWPERDHLITARDMAARHNMRQWH